MLHFKPQHPGMGTVIPAQAGIQFSLPTTHVGWIPACAGMTLSNTVRLSELENSDDTRCIVSLSSGNRQVEVFESLGLANG